MKNSNNVRTYTENEQRLFELLLVSYRNSDGQYEIPRLENGIIVDTPMSYIEAQEYLSLWIEGIQEDGSTNFNKFVFN